MEAGHQDMALRITPHTPLLPTHILLPGHHRVKSLLSEDPAARVSSPSIYYQTVME